MMRKLMMIATVTLAMGGASLAVPATAQPRTVVEKTVIRHDDNGRHMGQNMRRHRHCTTTWKHHHRVVKCRYY